MRTVEEEVEVTSVKKHTRQKREEIRVTRHETVGVEHRFVAEFSDIRNLLPHRRTVTRVLGAFSSGSLANDRWTQIAPKRLAPG